VKEEMQNVGAGHILREDYTYLHFIELSSRDREWGEDQDGGCWVSCWRIATAETHHLDELRHMALEQVKNC